MPAPTAPFIGFLLGIAFAWARGDETSRSGVSASTALWLVSLFGALIFAPVSAYFLSLAPDWSYAYLLDSRRIPKIVELVLVLVDALCVPLGFATASALGVSRRVGTLLRLSSAPVLLVLAFVAATFPRLSVHASYAQFHGDFGVRSAAGSPLGYALLWMAAVITGAVAWTVRSLRRQSPIARRD